MKKFALIVLALFAIATLASAQMGDSKGELAQVAALLQSLNVTAQGQVTTVSLSVPETQIEQMMQRAGR